MVDASNTPQRTKARNACIASTAIVVLLLVPYALAVLFSSLWFTAPGSMQNPLYWLAFVVLVSIPVSALLSVVVSWICFVRGLHVAAYRIAVAGIVIAAVPFAILMVIATLPPIW
jgi:hypothetical protein